jgi:hypothetical protein
VAQTEEELFQFYVPLAHMLAHNHDTSGNPDHARRRAELGLAKAILIWPLPDVAWFEEYARNAIHAEFVNGSQRTLPTNPLLRRARAINAYRVGDAHPRGDDQPTQSAP